jgi:formylglycine-generating enzyme required for sulfatase activity
VGNSSLTKHPAGRKKPNAWGLCDTYGNVEEWCADWYAERHYASSAEDEPTGPRLGRDRVVRGGSLGVDPYFARSASRSMAGAGGRAASCGFRVVCVAKALAPGSPTEYP